MKKVIVILLAIAVHFSSDAQTNIFPPSGNVGIGTASPQAKLHVAEGDLLLQSTTSGYPILWSKDLTGTKTLRLDYNSIIVQGDNAIISANGNNILLNTTAGGNVGIGTTNATEKLTIAGHTKVSEGANFFLQASALSPNDPGDLVFQKADGTETSRIFTDPGGNGSFYFATGSGIATRMILTGDGNLGIGTTDPQGYRLAVNGDAIFTKVKVKPYNSWPDYVFQPAYRLLPLSEVEKFIQQNGHLPEVPSAAEVEKEGLDLGSGQAVLLKKIEELTLYLIEQDKRIEKLIQENKKLNELKNEINKLKGLTDKK